jgi:hypothetical protein
MDSDFRADEASLALQARAAVAAAVRIQHAVLSLLSMRKARPSPWLPTRLIGRRRSRRLAGGSDVTGEQTGMKKLGVEAGANLMGKELEIKETQTRPRAQVMNHDY